ncbi:MAG TPA: hypothetical protein DIC58_03770 [Gammaproteobacteria bacterium]|nr:hypothetical protein [Gammaproteobacteria bacterium]
MNALYSSVLITLAGSSALLVQHRFVTQCRELLVSGYLSRAHAIAPLLFRIIQRRVRAYENLW